MTRRAPLVAAAPQLITMIEAAELSRRAVKREERTSPREPMPPVPDC